MSELSEEQVPGLKGSCHCGAVGWELAGIPPSATACNCTVCRRYGTLWAYGVEGQDITIFGVTAAHTPGDSLRFHFCPRCGCVVYWRGIEASENGCHRVAVNLRLSEPESVAGIQIRHFDGLGRFEALADDERCVADYWF